MRVAERVPFRYAVPFHDTTPLHPPAELHCAIACPLCERACMRPRYADVANAAGTLHCIQPAVTFEAPPVYADVSASATNVCT